MRALALSSTRRQPLPAIATPTAHARAPPTRLYAGEDGDASKCPFFGGPNGGGIGDANIATALLFVLLIVVLRVLLINTVFRPRRILLSLMFLFRGLPGAAAATAAAPGAFAHYNPPQGLSAASSMQADFIWTDPIPKLQTTASDAVVASVRFRFENGAEGYFGSQVWRAGAVDERQDPVLANETHRFILSVTSSTGGGRGLVRSRGGTCADLSGRSICTVVLPFVAGNAYSVGMGLVASNATGEVWSASVKDVKGGGAAVVLGELVLPNGYGKLTPRTTAGLEYSRAGSCEAQAVASVGIVGPWFEGAQFSPSQAFAHYAAPCAYSDAFDCIYGAGCGPLRALLTTGGKTKRSHANESAPLW